MKKIEESTKTYDRYKLERLRQNLQIRASQGAPYYYEIWVDNMKVVNRTCDLERFDDFTGYIDDDTEIVRVTVFTASDVSPKVTERHTFRLKEEKALNGPESGPSPERERWEADQVKKELEQTKQKLVEAEQYIDKLSEELEKYRNKKLHLGNVNLGEVASILLEGFIRRNPQMLAKLPGGEALAGAIEQDNKERLQTLPQPEAEVSFKKKVGPDSPESSLTAEQQAHLQLLSALEEHLGQKELDTVLLILDRFVKDSSMITEVAELLDIPLSPDLPENM